MRAWTDALQQLGDAAVRRRSCMPGSPGSTSCSCSAPRVSGTSWSTRSPGAAASSSGRTGGSRPRATASSGDVRRLRGDVVGARSAYDRTRDLGVTPQPGEALLDEAEGRRRRGARRAAGRPGRGGPGRPGPPAAARRWRSPCAPATWRSGRGVRAPSSRRRPRSTTPPGCGPGPTTRPPASCSTAAPGMPPWPAPRRRRPAVYRVQRCRHATARVHELRGARPRGTRRARQPRRPRSRPRWRSTAGSGPRPTSPGWSRTGRRAGSPGARRRCCGCVLGGSEQPRRRRAPRHQREDGQPPPGEHLRQGRGVEPHGGGRLGPRARRRAGAHRAGACTERPHEGRERLHDPPDAGRAGAFLAS